MLLAFVFIKMKLHWKSNPVGKVPKNLGFFKDRKFTQNVLGIFQKRTVYESKVDALEIAVFHSLDINEGILAPESDLRYAIVQRIDAKRYSLSWGGLIHLEL